MTAAGPGDGVEEAVAERRAAVHADVAAIVQDLVPRLIESHPVPRPEEQLPTEADVLALARRSIAGDLDGARALLAAAPSTDWAMLKLVPAAARCLGEGWEEDRWSFADVTCGIGTLQRLLREPRQSAPPLCGSSLLVLTSLPREQHTLGAFLLGEWLRSEGFSVHVEPGLHVDELADLVCAEPVAAVGFTVSDQGLVGSLVDHVARVRRETRADLPVLFGGCADLGPAAQVARAVHCATARDAAAWLTRHLGGRPLRAEA